MVVRYKKGRQVYLADTLSRAYLPETHCRDVALEVAGIYRYHHGAGTSSNTHQQMIPSSPSSAGPFTRVGPLASQTS